MCRRVVLLCCLGLVATVSAQQQEHAPSFSITRDVQLVQVPVVVLHKGSPVRGLTRSDFELLYEGRKQPIEIFEEVEKPVSNITVPKLTPQTAQNYMSGDPHQEIVIILMDFLNAGFSSTARIRSYIGEVVKAYTDAHTPIALLALTADGLRQVHSFTASPENLTGAIAAWDSNIRRGKDLNVVSFEPFAAPFAPTDSIHTSATLRQATLPRYFEAWRLDPAARMTLTLDAIEQISEAYASIPGHKRLIWMSTEFPGVPADFPPDSGSVSLQFTLRERQARAWRSLSNANIAVYPIDSNGVVNPAWEGHFSADSGPGWPKAPSLEVCSNIPSLLEVAENTGGTNCELNPTECVARMLREDGHYYLLGFYLRSDEKPGWKAIKVKVGRDGATVRARAGFWLGAADVARRNASKTKDRTGASAGNSSDKDQVMTALSSPLDYTAVPLQLQWSILAQDKGRAVIELVVTSPPGGIVVDPATHKMSADYLAFFKPVGKTQGRTFPKSLDAQLSPQQERKLRTSGFRFRKQITVDAGRYDIRVFLRDNIAQRIGTVSTLVNLR